jgi:uncharacterized SAM-binding protein YcdF (DUF218 family)
MRFAGPLSRWLRRLQFLASCLGLLLIAITLAVPVLHYWTTALSVPWGDENGDVLIVLGGDIVAPDMIGQTSYWRSFYGVREWRTGRYHRIVVTGKDIAPLMKDFMTSQGVPPQVVLVENTATSTRENALDVAALLREDTSRKVLLTSDFHMRRALGAFRKAGVDAAPLAIPDAHKRLNDWTQRWSIFWLLLQETAKAVYYKAHGWV